MICVSNAGLFLDKRKSRVFDRNSSGWVCVGVLIWSPAPSQPKDRPSLRIVAPDFHFCPSTFLPLKSSSVFVQSMIVYLQVYTEETSYSRYITRNHSFFAPFNNIQFFLCNIVAHLQPRELQICQSDDVFIVNHFNIWSCFNELP